LIRKDDLFVDVDRLPICMNE